MSPRYAYDWQPGMHMFCMQKIDVPGVCAGRQWVAFRVYRSPAEGNGLAAAKSGKFAVGARIVGTGRLPALTSSWVENVVLTPSETARRA